MFVKQTENVLLLLEFFAERPEPATLTQISQHFGWPKSSTFNIISTLVTCGYFYETQDRKGFYPTPLWLQLATAISDADPVPERLARLVNQLADASGETVWLSIPSGMFRLNIMVRESQQQVRVAARVGDRLPIQAAASGQALMSQMPEKTVSRILQKADYHPYGENTPTSAEAVKAQIAAGRQRGWFQSLGNYSAGLGGVSVPVVEGARLLAITIAGPLFRIEGELPRFARMIHEAMAREYGADFIRTKLKGIALLKT